MDFNSFAIAGPDTVLAASPTGTAIAPNVPVSSATECHNAWFTASSDGTNPPVLCGTNTGYHSKPFDIADLVLDIILLKFMSMSLA